MTLAQASISIVTILKNISTFAKTAFAAICLLAFTSAAFAQAPVQRTVDGIIAKVDNHVVLRSDVEFGYLQYLQQSKQQPNEELKCEIFRSLLQDKLLLARAEIDSVVVEEPLVADQLDRRIQYLASQVGGVERLEQYYNKNINQLKDDLRRTVREQMVMERMQQEIIFPESPRSLTPQPQISVNQVEPCVCQQLKFFTRLLNIGIVFYYFDFYQRNFRKECRL